MQPKSGKGISGKGIGTGYPIAYTLLSTATDIR